VGLAVAYLGPSYPKVKLQLWGQSSFPLAWTVFIPFVIAAMLNIYAFVVAGTAAYPELHGLALVLLSALPPVLSAAGGAIEGLVAETRFNQWIHFFAVVLLNLGQWTQLWMLEKLTAGLPV
jgi:hypothetical protein